MNMFSPFIDFIPKNKSKSKKILILFAVFKFPKFKLQLDHLHHFILQKVNKRYTDNEDIFLIIIWILLMKSNVK